MDKVVHTFPRGISPKMNVKALFEFELAYNNIAVQHVNHYTNCVYNECDVQFLDECFRQNLLKCCLLLSLYILLVKWITCLTANRSNQVRTQVALLHSLSDYFPRERNKVKLATVVEGNSKAPFSIATAMRCTGGRYSFPSIRTLYC